MPEKPIDPTAIPPAVQPQAPEYRLPSLDKGATSFYDDGSGSFWIGIPLRKMDPFNAVLVLDNAKLNLVTAFAQDAVKRKLLTPGFKDRLFSAAGRGSEAVKKLFNAEIMR